MASAPRSSGVTKATVARGLRAGNGAGLDGDFSRVRVVRNEPNRRVGVGAKTIERVAGGSRQTNFVGKLRAGATTSL